MSTRPMIAYDLPQPMYTGGFSFAVDLLATGTN